MAFINTSDQEYIIVGRETLLFYSCETNAGVVERFPEVEQKKSKDETCDDEVEKPPKLPETEDKNHVLCCAFSECRNLIAIADNVKRLILWKKENKSWKVLFNRCSTRKCIKIKFSPSGKYLLAADRSGDVYRYLVDGEDENGTLLLGHLSMLLDMVFSNDETFVITCDRDEKIRVSCFPNAYNIHNYCLGHTEFVSSITICGENREYLLSGSGDGTLRLWNYKAGKQLFSLSYSNFIEKENQSMEEGTKIHKAPPVRTMIVSKNGLNIVALFDGITGASIFKLIHHKADNPEIVHMQNISLEVEMWDVAFLNDNKLFGLLPLERKTIVVYVYDQGKEKWVADSEQEYKAFSMAANSIWTDLKELVGIKSCFQNLYKQWYDNVEIYMEKKKLRQEQKFKKLKITT